MRLRPALDKNEALAELAKQASMAEAPRAIEAAAATLAAIAEILPRAANAQIAIRDSEGVQGVAARLVFGRHARTFAPPLHLSGMPTCFTPLSPVAHSPDFQLLTVPGGYICHAPDMPLVVSGHGDTVLRDYSSPYAGLLHYYDVDLPRILAGAPQINGTVIAIADDVRPLNFCHWMVDWLPRLASLGELATRSDTYVAVPPLNAAYQTETLRLCGFDGSRVLQLGPWQAVRARHLLVPSDFSAIPHPGHKAAPWLLSYLRGTLGFGCLTEGANLAGRPSKLYVSRGTAAGRRVLNEPALLAALAPHGYRAIDPSGMPVSEQIAAFAAATHIVAPHGAALASTVFANRRATLIEMFPASYGTAAYYVLAAGLGMTYASYIATNISAGDRSQLDDFSVDIADFMLRAGPLL